MIANLERRYHETDSMAVREELAKYQNNKPCPACNGTRLRDEARHVMVGGVPIYQVSALPLKQALAFFEALTLDGHRAQIADKIVKEIIARVGFLNNVGLDYLSLDRSADTLSGGEAQRIRLASQIGSGLTGVMYVLDEPSIGLHQRDNDRLLATLKHLRDIGNSVIVVEHDEDAIRAADYVVDMGPGAGVHGGEIVAEGTPEEIRRARTRSPASICPGGARIAIPKKRRAARRRTATGADRRQRQQSEKRHAESARRAVRLHHRRLRLGQIDADQRHAVRRRRAPSVRLVGRARAARRNPRPGILRQGDQRRPVADRPHAALQPGDLHRPVHADPRTVRRRAGSARARLRPRPLLASTSRADAARPARATA